MDIIYYLSISIYLSERHCHCSQISDLELRLTPYLFINIIRYETERALLGFLDFPSALEIYKHFILLLTFTFDLIYLLVCLKG